VDLAHIAERTNLTRKIPHHEKTQPHLSVLLKSQQPRVDLLLKVQQLRISQQTGFVLLRYSQQEIESKQCHRMQESFGGADGDRVWCDKE
jgi:hypothetical protein